MSTGAVTKTNTAPPCPYFLHSGPKNTRNWAGFTTKLKSSPPTKSCLTFTRTRRQGRMDKVGHGATLYAQNDPRSNAAEMSKGREGGGARLNFMRERCSLRCESAWILYYRPLVAEKSPQQGNPHPLFVPLSSVAGHGRKIHVKPHS